MCVCVCGGVCGCGWWVGVGVGVGGGYKGPWSDRRAEGPGHPNKSVSQSGENKHASGRSDRTVKRVG